MAKLLESSNYIIISSNLTMFLFSKRDSVPSFSLDVPPVLKKEISINNEDDKIMKEEDKIVCSAVSKEDEWLAITTLTKKLIIWHLPTRRLRMNLELVKRPTAIIFHPFKSEVIIADKHGDVYSVGVDVRSGCRPDDNGVVLVAGAEEDGVVRVAGPELKLGHFSVLHHVAISSDGGRLLTCDRDEKVRVSRYPNCHSVVAFCLAHDRFVSHVVVLPPCEEGQPQSRCVTSSGDGTLKLWHFESGRCLATLDLSETLREATQDASGPAFVARMTVRPTNTRGRLLLAAAIFRSATVAFVRVTSDACTLLSSVSLAEKPLCDALFLGCGRLLLLQQGKGDSQGPLVLLEVGEEEEAECVAVRPLRDHPLALFGRQRQVAGWDSWQLEAESLFKTRFDNVAEYLRHKAQRLSDAASPPPPPKRKPSAP